MNDDQKTPHPGSSPSREELMSALFASLVLQQANMVLIFLGKVPHPESGKEIRDLEAARIFVDNLEMLESKTKGNLTQHEAALLKQSLMNARMAYVEVADKAPAAPPPAPSASPSGTEGKESAPGPGGEAAADDRKKYVKKY